MSRLERATKPILAPMLQSEVAHVSATEQQVLAAWAAKTILAFDLTRAEPVVPDECRREVMQHEQPPEGTVLLLARYVGTRFPLYGAHGTERLTVGATPDWLTFLASVSLGPVVFQLFGHGIANAIDLRPAGWKADFAHVLWPTSHSLTWPLPRALGDDGLQQFVRKV